MPYTYILIREDPDSFIGYNPDAEKQIDIEASKAAYEAAVINELSKYYPMLEVEFDWTPGTQWYPPEMDLDEQKRLAEILTDIEAKIYNTHSFWVLK